LGEEFSELKPNPDHSSKKVVLEVGCGTGSTALPLLNGNPDLFFHCCDLSETAIHLLKENKYYDPQRCNAFVCDITKDSLTNHGIAENSLDFIMLIFVLSSIPTQKNEDSGDRITNFFEAKWHDPLQRLWIV